MIYALAFLASGVAVVLAGMELARSADAIAKQTRIGRVWIGTVLVAGATSLPELTTDVVAVRLGASDIGVGDLFGSSLANMLILALLDLVPPRRGILRRVALDHALGASLAIGLNAFAALLVLVRSDLAVGPMALGSLIGTLAYLIGVRGLYGNVSSGQAVAPPPEVETGETSDPRAPHRFALAAGVVLLAAPAFAWSARGVAEATGLGQAFVGAALVGLATSLPELVSCLAALRMGAFDLAVGNLFGSNALNMAMLLALDLAQPGSLFANLDSAHAVAGLFAVVMMALGLAGILFRGERRWALLRLESLLMVAVYVAALATLRAFTAAS